MKTEKYFDAQQHWPKEGKCILAQQTEQDLIVYQAFSPAIANYAVLHQKFGGPNYSFNRMTWIKPNFLWMMYRAGWATKVNQERILAITISKESFDQILSKAVVSSYKSNMYDSREEWKKEIENSNVRLQWDPDHDPYGNKEERRAIQIGLRGEDLTYFHDQIRKIEDVTAFVHEQAKHVNSGQLDQLLVPMERVYLPDSDEAIRRVGL